MWQALNTWERFFAVVIVMGSVVDIFQFTWLVRKSYAKMREKVYDRVRKEILLSQLSDRQLSASKLTQRQSSDGSEIFLGLSEREQNGIRKKASKKGQED